MQTDKRVEYSPLPHRKPLRWPDGARLAVWVSPNLERWIPDTPAAVINDSTSGLRPDVLNAAWREYGARVGFWRLLDLMDRLGIRGSADTNASACEYYPQIIEAAAERNWEFLGHGITNSVLHAEMAEEKERQEIRAVYNTLQQATGKAPAGWLGPALTETHLTPDLLVEEGFKYVADWCDDDQPHLIRTRSGQRLLSVPYSLEINDYTAFLGLKLTGEQFGQMIRDQFDVLYREGARTGMVMCVALHPFLIGQPHRFVHLERALTYMKQHDGIWWTTGAEIADWYAAHCLDQA